MALQAVACLCCSRPVLVDVSIWAEKGYNAGMCRRCYDRLQPEMIYLIFRLRLEMMYLYQMLGEAQQHIGQLFTAQQELEELALGT